jgi:type VI secretion system secreted protein VgrG
MIRSFELSTPLGEDVLLFFSMTVTEELSRLGEYTLEMLSERGDVDLDKILAKRVSIKVSLPDDETRHFTAYVTRFAQVGMRGRYYAYRATLQPWLWFLTRTADCRIFQEKTVPEILKEVLDEHPLADYKVELTGSYRKREYCVQYRETDFNFLSRLMEEEGIYYYFRHGERNNTLVLADAYSAHSPVSGYEQLPFLPPARAVRTEQEHVSGWDFAREVQPGKFVLDDYDFQKPSVDLRVSTSGPRGHDHAEGEIFDYPGEYIVTGDGEHYARTRIDELHARYELAQGESNARGLTVGRLFKLTGHPRSDQNREYLVVKATHTLQSSEYESLGSEGEDYACAFTALHSHQAFRPERITRRPTVKGPQTAVVVGPGGDEIYTDKYGRVKVQFHWDRYGKKDENSSCWIRVSHPWAGKNWGMVAIPRMGHEVIVDFLEGDPDQPIITGRVYNAEQMPPYDLPANMTQTGIKSRSSKGGSGANFNEIRFEDKKGAEQVFIHAEKNQDIEVENDETHWVGHDRKKTIDNDETTLVKHDRTETVNNNETITIHANRTETVDKEEKITIHGGRTEVVDGNENITIHSGRTEKVDQDEKITIDGSRTEKVGVDENITIVANRTEKVGAEEKITIGGGRTENVKNDEKITIGGSRTESVKGEEKITITGGRTENVTGEEGITLGAGRQVSVKNDDKLSVGQNLTITAGKSITIQTGKASITMNSDGTITITGKGITINGKDIKTDASGEISTKASKAITMKGQKILQN